MTASWSQLELPLEAIADRTIDPLADLADVAPAPATDEERLRQVLDEQPALLPRRCECVRACVVRDPDGVSCWLCGHPPAEEAT